MMEVSGLSKQLCQPYLNEEYWQLTEVLNITVFISYNFTPLLSNCSNLSHTTSIFPFLKSLLNTLDKAFCSKKRDFFLYTLLFLGTIVPSVISNYQFSFA